MDVKSLRAFKKICDVGSISKAAEALYITQPGAVEVDGAP